MIELQRGDVFLTRSDKLFGKLIRIRGRMRSPDGEANYNHAGIIAGEDGASFESRRRIDDYSIYDFTGQQVLIARTTAQEFATLAAIRRLTGRYHGKVYPWWRIVLHALTPFLARKLHASYIPVCSELVAEFLYLINCRHGECWGTTPDVLEDELKNYRQYTIIFEGILPAREPQ